MNEKQVLVKEAIILAGGLGTRLREAVPDLPKCMAPVAGHPFIYHIIKYFQVQGIQSFLFSLGYMHEVIENYLINDFPTLNYTINIEEEPLGTGGAIKKTLALASEENMLILNGDTLFEIDLKQMSNFHYQENSACTIALKPMNDFDRYGVVTLDESGTVTRFQEKKYFKDGNINGGVYLINKTLFDALSFPEKFSFEKDYLEKYFSSGKIKGSIHQGYFIDIGIPEDFLKAQKDLAK